VSTGVKESRGILRSTEWTTPSAAGIANKVAASCEAMDDPRSGETGSPGPASVTHHSPSPDVADDFAVLVDILSAVEPSMPPRECPREEQLVTIRFPHDVSVIESAGLDCVARSLATAESCNSALTQSNLTNAKRVGDVMTAEMTRAAAVLQLLRFLNGDYTPIVTTVSIRAIIERARHLADPELRLRGIYLSPTACMNDVSVPADEGLLSHLLLSLLLATVTLLDGIKNPTVALAAEQRAGGVCAVSIMQTHVAPPLAWTVPSAEGTRAYNEDDSLRLVALSASHRFAETTGGLFAAVAGECSTRFSFDLPAS
jgi:hypothetical protein